MNRRGFTLIEVVVGTVLLVMSATFMMSAYLHYVRAEAATMLAENLSLIDENTAREVMALLQRYVREQTRPATGYCNFTNTPTTPTGSGLTWSTMFNTPLGNGLKLKLVNPAALPPDFPSAGEYTAARERCRTAQTDRTAVGGAFGSQSAIYFCTLLDVDTSGGNAAWAADRGGTSMASQTLLGEWMFQMRKETDGSVVTCENLINQALFPPPASSDPVMATLSFTMHTINRKTTTTTTSGSETYNKVSYKHSKSSIHNSMPYVTSPPFNATTMLDGDYLITDFVMIGGQPGPGNGPPTTPGCASHYPGRVGAPVSLTAPCASIPAVNFRQGNRDYYALRGTTDCSWGVCQGQTLFAASYAPFPPTVPGTKVLLDIYIDPMANPPSIPGHVVGGGTPPTPPGGWSAAVLPSPSFVSQIADMGACNYGTCTGDLIVRSRTKPWASLSSGTPVIAGIWMHPPGTHISLNLDCGPIATGPPYTNTDSPCCPRGFVPMAEIPDCAGVTAGAQCDGKQVICAHYIAKP